MDRRASGQGRPKRPPVTPPAHLDAQARAKWLQIAGTIDAAAPGRADALAAYCQAWSRWKEAERQIAALGLVVKSPAGFPVENPYLGVSKRALIEMHRWGRELRLVAPSPKSAQPA